MLKVETDITNVDIINAVVLPRLKHMINNASSYSIKRPSLGRMNFLAETTINAHDVRILTGLMQGTGSMYVIIQIWKLNNYGNTEPKIEVRIDSINPTNVTGGVDKFHQILCTFLGMCLEKESRDVIVAHDKIFGDIDNAKVVKISG